MWSMRRRNCDLHSHGSCLSHVEKSKALWTLDMDFGSYRGSHHDTSFHYHTIATTTSTPLLIRCYVKCTTAWVCMCSCVSLCIFDLNKTTVTWIFMLWLLSKLRGAWGHGRCLNPQFYCKRFERSILGQPEAQKIGTKSSELPNRCQTEVPNQLWCGPNRLYLEFSTKSFWPTLGF